MLSLSNAFMGTWGIVQTVAKSACIKHFWPYRLTVRTADSQFVNPGSIPGRVKDYKLEFTNAIESIQSGNF